MYAMTTTAKTGTGLAWTARKALQDDHVESEVSRRPEQACPVAAVNEEPRGVLDGVRERRDRAGNPGVLGMRPLGMGAGARGDRGSRG